MGEPVLVFDNGGGALKAGLSTYAQPFVMHNFTARSKSDKRNYVGDDIDNCIDTASLLYRRPFERGYLVNWEAEKDVWERAFSRLKTRPAGLEVVFEEMQFASFYSAPASVFVARQLGLTAALVIDAGYSFSHASPVFDGAPLTYATKRVNMGGKALTNYLKEIVSYRQWNMMDETYLINHVKERLCYVAEDYMAELHTAKYELFHNFLTTRSIRREYVLPDYTTTARGFVRPLDWVPPTEGPKSEEQVLVLNNERISVPELLFSPSDIGVPQAGIAEAALQAVNATTADLRPLLWNSVAVVGGCALFPGFSARLLRDLRPLAPADAYFNIVSVANPVSCAWHGAATFVTAGDFARHALTRADYLEKGAAYCVARLPY